MQKVKLLIIIFIFPLLGIGCVCQDQKTPVDYVNAYIGNISHLLVPTYPTVHLPNSMLRVYAQRLDYTGDRPKLYFPPLLGFLLLNLKSNRNQHDY